METTPSRTVELRGLRLDDEASATAGHAELAADGFTYLPFFEAGEPWGVYLRRVSRLSAGEGLPPGFVPWSDLYAVLDGDVAGRVSVRHELTESLAQVGGHIGYAVRPGFRRQGYATLLLRTGLLVARDLGIDRALVTCADDNIASVGVIERCGGVLEDLVDIPGATRRRRYRLPTR